MPAVLAADSTEARERFHACLELVDIVARQIAKRLTFFVELDELLSSGREGLLDAARRYDPSRGVPFRAYANFRVQGAIYDGLRRTAGLPGALSSGSPPSRPRPSRAKAKRSTAQRAQVLPKTSAAPRSF